MKQVALFMLLCAITFSCTLNKEDDPTPDVSSVSCNNLITGLIAYNDDKVKVEINKLLADLHPSSTDDDPSGHKNNTDTLLNRLNTCCDGLRASLVCYNCILTYPGQSEIRVDIDSSGYKVSRTIDICNPEDDILRFMRAHEYFRETGTLQGKIGLYEGNCMPGPGVPPCIAGGLSTTVVISTPDNEFHWENLVDSTVSNSYGDYSIELEVGHYSLFLRDGDTIDCQGWSCPDGICVCHPFEIIKDSVTTLDANINHAVW